MSELNNAISNIKVELQKSNIIKSGKNEYAGFEYFELSDFLPSLNVLMLKYGVNDCISFKDNLATLSLIKGDEKQDYSIPFTKYETPLNNKGKQSMQDIQYLGALLTYYKRYMYMNAFGISAGDVVDALDNDKLELQDLNQAKKKLAQLLQAKGKDINYIKSFANYFDAANDKSKLLLIIDNIDDSIDKYNEENEVSDE